MIKLEKKKLCPFVIITLMGKNLYFEEISDSWEKK